ncbi:MAG: V-type ATP synthase subunit A [Caldilineaceae bacterium]
MNDVAGILTWISGPVVRVHVTAELAMLEQVWVGAARLTGEVISLHRDEAVVQVYEETTGLRPGEPLYRSQHPLAVTLGPGLLGSIFDGIQRPLAAVRDQTGIYIPPGIQVAPLSQRSWPFTPHANEGDQVEPGALLGTLPETPLIEHRILVPPRVSGKLVHIVPAGEYKPDATLAVVQDDAGNEHPLTMVQQWPVRQERPVTARLEPNLPLITGQRVLDTFFPIAKGGTAAIPGPFGAGKTVTQHSLAKWSDAQIIIYVGCGERGNEMAQVLEDFPKLTDPWSGRPLMERTILIANTSNMPVAAREASIYTGITIAEYYRDQGYDVALMADSTSRWAEALREISGRLEEMPAEEGFPAYLPSRLAAFYERTGRVRTLGGREGSVTAIGAVSPPGGDFSEPVTQHTQRFTRCFWALDRNLASARHFPAINWLTSYSFYADAVAGWWHARVDPAWLALRQKAMDLLEQEARLQEIVRLVGADALPDRQRWVLDAARLLEQGFLQQNALHLVDAYTVPAKQLRLLRFFVDLFEQGRDLIAAGVPVVRLRQVLDVPRLVRLKEEIPNDQLAQIDQLWTTVQQQLQTLAAEQRQQRVR